MSAAERMGLGDPLGPEPVCRDCEDAHIIEEHHGAWCDETGDEHESYTESYPCPACLRRERVAMTTMIAAARVARRVFTRGN